MKEFYILKIPSISFSPLKVLWLREDDLFKKENEDCPRLQQLTYS